MCCTPHTHTHTSHTRTHIKHTSHTHTHHTPHTHALQPLAGIMIIALPTSILGTNFMRQYQKLQQSDEREKRARAREASAATHDPAARLAQMKSANEEMRDVLRQVSGLRDLIE